VLLLRAARPIILTMTPWTARRDAAALRADRAEVEGMVQPRRPVSRRLVGRWSKGRWCAMRRARPGSHWSSGRITRRAQYAAYMGSIAWQEKRRDWYQHWRSTHHCAPVCLVCGCRWSLRSGQLHHVTYMRLAAEEPDDLVPLCPTHHARLHELWDGSPQWRALGRPPPPTASSPCCAAASRHRNNSKRGQQTRPQPAAPSRPRPSPGRVVSGQLPLDVEDDGADIWTATRTSTLVGTRSGSSTAPSTGRPSRCRNAIAGWTSWRSGSTRLISRFALDTRVIPPCWPRHNALVEALSALRDHERASYHQTAPPTAAVDWLRALRDVEALLRSIAAQTQCTTQTHRSEIRRVPRPTDPTDSEQV
jgi:hypothetical protein